MSFENLQDLFMEQINDLYSAEQQMIGSLPQMADAASSPDLRVAFEEHLEQTRTQAQRLEQIFNSLGVQPESMKCKGMEGILEEGNEILQKKGEPSVIDAALIAAAQRAEHYEMASYGCARTFAEQLGFDDIADLLQETLDEEGETNDRLTMLAEGGINLQAEEEGEEEYEDEDEDMEVIVEEEEYVVEEYEEEDR